MEKWKYNYSRLSSITVGILFLLLISNGEALTTARALKTVLRLSSEVLAEKTLEESSKSSSSKTEKFAKPPRLIPEDPSLIPSLYNYDHCPFCVRVRLALGFKNIKHNLVFMANDDVHTPTSMVGKKIAPIMVSGQRERKNGVVGISICTF